MFVVLPEVNNNLNFDVNEFVPIGFVAEQPYALLVSKQSGINSVAELIDASKKQPGGLDAVAGTRGGLQHMTVEGFRKPDRRQAQHDPLSGRGAVAATTSLPAGCR